MLTFARYEPTARTHPIAIAGTDVHVWAFTLDESEAIVDAWSELLSDDEKLRVDHFAFRRDRSHSIVARGVLRHLLAQYCGIDAKRIAFRYALWGKPSVVNGVTGAKRVMFNLAHSHGRALFAVTLDREIGVDLECVRDNFDPLPIARQFFFGAEFAAIRAAAPGLQREAFYRHWVAKEAVLKANGVGLSLALESFGVTFDPEGAVARVRSVDPAALDETLVVRMLPVGTGWCGAVATSEESRVVEPAGGWQHGGRPLIANRDTR